MRPAFSRSLAPLRRLVRIARLGLSDLDADVPAPLKIATVRDDAIRAMLLDFENIGATCEFGLVQRRYGAEPLSLFRWNLVPWRALIRALDRDLEGLGEPENTILDRSTFGEYLVRDARYGFGLNTFKRPEEVDADALLAQMCTRIAYLREKFLRDVAAGEKILVYRLTVIDEPEVVAIHTALRRLGPVRLLGVLGAERDTRPSLHQPAPSLCIGRVRTGQFPTHWDIPFEDWVALCRMAQERLAR